VSPLGGARAHIAQVRRAAARWRQHGRRAWRALQRGGPGRSLGAVESARNSIAGVAHVTGWAYCPDETIEAVVILVDGEPRTLAQLGAHRPDVAAAFRFAPGSGRAGWSATVELPHSAGASVAVGAIAVTAAGLVERFDPVLVTMGADDEDPLAGCIERPAAGAQVAPGVVTVEGWALPSEPLGRVEIRVDGRNAGLARPLAAPRPDLARSRQPTAPLAGFVHTIDLDGCRPGDRVRIDGDVVTRSGRRTALDPVEIVVGPGRDAASIPPHVQTLRAQVADACATPSAVATPPVRLLVVTHQLGLGGGQLYLAELLRRLLVELDISCLVVAPHDGPLRAELEDLGATVHLCGDYPVASPGRYEAALLELAALAHDHGCNVAVVNTMGAFIGADLAHRLSIPAVWAIHESYPLDEYWTAAYGPDGIHPYVRAQAVEALRNVAALVFEADATRREYEPYGDGDRLITVPYGITVADVGRYRAEADRGVLRRAAGIPEHVTLLLCMGTYEPRKAQGALALAFAEIADEFPDVMLAFVGDTGGPYAQAVHDVVERFALGERIRLEPVVADSYAWYLMADALVSASDVESLPRSVLEAMAFEVPVLAASVFGLPELIDDGGNGLLCAPRDIDALVVGLRRLLAVTPERRAALGAEGAKLVRERYDASIYAGVYRTLLRGLLVDPNAFPHDLLAQ
jgi:glycosyltransferase involved in cell wall biosynthesis